MANVLQQTIERRLQSRSFRGRIAALGMTVPTDNTAQMRADDMRRETVRQRALAVLTGIKMTSPAH